ncbi:hypothetical protein H1164_03840 [Thermoactinomyces daqus]|uniref:Uncharacterized protein n=1 Tax=Thermoactinomyces daqus TaxID=1329516 RepID=A0A7W1X8J0_9BACL|nr:hypothetical protein [Thermoactinomyces daqus]MBA4542033.1 hypothetical protein [Thermoactinomyces daqus]
MEMKEITGVLNQLLQGQCELLEDNREFKKTLVSMREQFEKELECIHELLDKVEESIAGILRELKTATEATAYLSRDVLILKNRIG